KEERKRKNSPRKRNIPMWRGDFALGLSRKQSRLVPLSSRPLGVAMRRGREPFSSSKEERKRKNSPRKRNIPMWRGDFALGLSRKQSRLVPLSSRPLGVAMRRGREPFSNSKEERKRKN